MKEFTRGEQIWGIKHLYCEWYKDHLLTKNQNNSFNKQIRVININDNNFRGKEIRFFKNLISKSIINQKNAVIKKFLECFNSLLNHIPVFIVEEVIFLKYKENLNYPNECRPPFEIFGYYTRIGICSEIPSIFICYSKISEYSKRENIELKYLFSKVLIHEFAHALMDCDINISHSNDFITEYYEWMEESIANFITLVIIENSGDNIFLQIAEDFIKDQPDNYKLGLALFKDKQRDYLNWYNWWGEKNGINAPIEEFQRSKLANLRNQLKHYEKNNI